MTQFNPASFLHKTRCKGFTWVSLFNFRHPPDFMPPTSRRGTLYFVPNGRLLRHSSHVSFIPLVFSRASSCGARRGAAWTVLCKRWPRPGSVAHSLDGDLTQQATMGMASHYRNAIPGLEHIPGSSYSQLQKIVFLAFCCSATAAQSASRVEC